MREVSRLTLEQLCKFPLLSGNAKTSVSLDFPIGHTCAPTELCAAVCYASRPGTPARWDKSLVMRLRNLRYFQLASTRQATDRLWLEHSRAARSADWRGRVELNFLRVNGTGDLTIEVVRVLNMFAAEHPEIALWVVSRRPEIAQHLAPAPNLYLQLSMDASTTIAGQDATELLVTRNPRAYVSYLRTRPGEDTFGAAIVFNEKRTAGLGYDGISDCPADAGRLPLDNERGVGGTACSKCRKCFSDKTLERQRAVL